MNIDRSHPGSRSRRTRRRRGALARLSGRRIDTDARVLAVLNEEATLRERIGV